MGKETVLALLLREKGHFVSGEAVSAELGITRAAIWKSISALRAQGYVIDAVTGRGYCLKSLPDTLTEQTVRSYLGPVETVGKRIDCFDSIDSTNAYLKRIALDGAPVTLELHGRHDPCIVPRAVPCVEAAAAIAVLDAALEARIWKL